MIVISILQALGAELWENHGHGASQSVRPSCVVREGRGFADRGSWRRAAPSWRARKWSDQVTQKSDALDLERGVFASNDPYEIAILKKSSEKPQRRKVKSVSPGDVDLDFYINRAGRNPLRPKAQDHRSGEASRPGALCHQRR